MQSLYPIVLFVYNRPEHTLKVLDALAKNDLAQHSELYIYSDGARNSGDEKSVEEVRKVIRGFEGFKKIHITAAETNNGLSKSIINGLSKLFETYDGLIILEDDILVSEYFLQFMNESLNAYSEQDEVAGVTGYSYPFKKNKQTPNFYFLPIGSSWGWGTWKRVWDNINFDTDYLISQINDLGRVNEFNFGYHNFYAMLMDQKEGKIDTWDIRFYASFFLSNQFFFFPKYSMVKNIGFDGSGSHGTATHEFYNAEYKYQPFNEVEVKVLPQIVNNAMRLNRTKFSLSFIRRLFS